MVKHWYGVMDDKPLDNTDKMDVCERWFEENWGSATTGKEVPKKIVKYMAHLKKEGYEMYKWEEYCGKG